MIASDGVFKIGVFVGAGVFGAGAGVFAAGVFATATFVAGVLVAGVFFCSGFFAGDFLDGDENLFLCGEDFVSLGGRPRGLDLDLLTLLLFDKDRFTFFTSFCFRPRLADLERECAFDGAFLDFGSDFGDVTRRFIRAGDFDALLRGRETDLAILVYEVFVVF